MYVKSVNDLQEDIYGFIKEITILIVQRSYRILTNYQGNRLRKNDKEIMEKVFKQIGLEGATCIYSHKKDC